MASLIAIASFPPLSTNNVAIDKDEMSEIRLTNPHRQSPSIVSHVSASDFIVIWLGGKDSSLRSTLTEYSTITKITLMLFSTEEQLWSWLNTHESTRVACLVLENDIDIEGIVRRSSDYASVRSILIRCLSNQLGPLQRFSRSFAKVDGVFADDTRLLIKLLIDLALFSEQIADQAREDEGNELKAQRNYDRALHLCALARRL